MIEEVVEEMKRMIKSSSVKVPSKLSKIYKVVSDSELESMTGAPDLGYPCEEAEGYDAEHVAWLVPRDDKVEEVLSDNGYDIVELVKEGGDTFVGCVINGRLYNIEQDVLDLFDM